MASRTVSGTGNRASATRPSRSPLGTSAPVERQCGEQFLDEERDPLRTLGNGDGQRRVGRLAENHRDQRRQVGAGERAERDLDELAALTELCADPAQQVPARKLVAAVRADDARPARSRVRRRARQ